MTDTQQVLNIINRHHGRPHAITGQRIADLTGINERRVRLIIEDEINTIPIASITNFPPGYFIAVTREEVNNYAESLKKRGLKILIRKRDFLNASRTKVEPRQGVLV